tara:strand:- start:232 stop:804 length:573 start_codon:yes stop_codon:yes gene_type:complete
MNNNAPKNICICLSHKINDNYELSKDSKRRIKKTCSVFFEKASQLLITTGWAYKNGMKAPLSAMMSEIAESNYNVPRDKILEISQAKDTVGEAVFLKKYIEKMIDINEINIVTSDWHLKRSREIFSFVFGGSENIKILFHSIIGDRREKQLEEKKASIHKFRQLITNCHSTDFNSLHSILLSSHPLYKEK